MSAWSNPNEYKKHDPLKVYDEGTPLAYAVKAIKRELEFRGYSRTGFDPSVPFIGAQADKLIREFQRDSNLAVDGTAGPMTCRKLFARRCALEQSRAPKIPDDLVWKLIRLESGFDPGATGSADPHDRGLAQINSVHHPNVSDAQAFDPAFSIPFVARGMRTVYVDCHDWDGAIAAHNVGAVTASRWVKAGKPASGMISNDIDWAKRATKYVALVRA